jgi:outer membrane protein
MFRTLTALFALSISIDAFAAGIAVVDFQRAVTQTDEGKAAQAKIDTMYMTRKQEIEKMRTDLEAAVQDYQSRAMILSEAARADTEKKLAMQQQAFEQKYMGYQNELQQTYGTLLQDLDGKMRTLVQTIAKEKSYSVVLDAAAVVYLGSDVVDMTNELVTRYNVAYKK